MQTLSTLSLFNGMSFGKMALEALNIKGKYYSAEIDKYANQATTALFPDVIQLGDVTKWNDWDIDLGSIDLLLAGFPFQPWGLPGNQKGDIDPRGALLHDLIAIWKMINEARECYGKPPVKFMFENVKMKKEFLKYINELFGVEPICINSALVSAQNRVRYYWTNIQGVEQPEDKGITIEDIIDHDGDYTFMTEKFVSRQQGRKCLRDDLSGKAVNLSAMEYVKNGRQGDYINHQVASCKGRKPRIVTKNKTGKSNCLTASYYKGLDADCRDGVATPEAIGLEYKKALDFGYRKFTPRECFRLQTVPEHYIEILLNSGISNTQLYKMCGNGWTLDVIINNLKGLVVESKKTISARYEFNQNFSFFDYKNYSFV